MRNMKKWMALLMAATMTVTTFAGCGGGSSAEGKKDAAQEEQKGEGNAEEPVTLTMYAPGNSETDLEVFQAIINDFKKERPYVDVEVVQIPWSDYFTKLNVAFSGGTSPDLYGVGLGQIGPVQAAGNMLELNPYLEDWDGFEDIPQNILDIASKDGKLYGCPMIEVRALYYRKDLVEKAGLTEPPKSMEELEEYAKKLVEVDETGKITCSGLELTTGSEQTLFSTMLMKGADRLWNEDGSSAMSEDKALEALSWMQKLQEEGVSEFGVMHNVEGSQFQNGVAAMSMEASSAFKTIVNNLGEEKVGISLLPTENYMIGTTCWAVSNDSKHKEEAVDLWKAFASKEGQLKCAEGMGFVPTRATAKDEYVAMNPEYNEVFFEVASKGKAYGTLNPYFFEFVNNLRPMIEEVQYGNMSPEDAIAQFEKTYSDAVKEASEN